MTTASDKRPRVLIITVHPDENSLTVSVAQQIAAAVQDAGGAVTLENLAAAGFPAAYTSTDMRAYRSFYAGTPLPAPPEVAQQHTLLDDADVLVLVFPVHWWSMPAQMKGWLERTLTGAWLWPDQPSTTTTALTRMSVHLVPLTGGTEDSYERHGYRQSMITQFEHGIFDYLNTGDTTWHWLWNAATNPHETLTAAARIGDAISAAHNTLQETSS